MESRRLLTTFTTVDPADALRLATSSVLAEWNTDGNYSGWTVGNAATSGVAGGTLNLTSKTDGTAMTASLQSIASGPYLDYAYFNYLQVRAQFPANYNQDVTVQFGTNTASGFASTRQFTIPGSKIAADGQYHIYRIDLSVQVWWKDTLTDLRLSLPGSTTAPQNISLDYVEAGDLPNDSVTTYTTGLNMATGVTAATRQSVESKHFVFWYDPAVNPGGRTNWSTMAHNALHMSEESWAVYTKLDGYSDPTNYVHDGQRHKINIITWYAGYWMGGPYFNVDTSGLQDEGSGNPVPHEFGHVIDGQQGSALAGGHWESHADFHRSSWSENYAPYFASNAGFEMQTKALEMSNVRQDYPFLIYDDSRIFQAAKEAGIEAALWQQGTADATVYNKLAQILPAGTSVTDWLGQWMSRWPMLDFSNRTLMRAHYWDTAANKAYLDFVTGSPLVPEPDLGSGWYRVPTERSPEKFAYMFHNLTPTGTALTVTLRGLSNIDATADWRWGLQEIDSSNNVRYSAIWGPGTQSWTLNSASNKVILFVIATPSDNNVDLAADYNQHPLQRDTNHLQYPYEVQITGATPTTGAGERLNYATSTGHAHSNGGGWVDNTATVASTAYVGPNARVLGNAIVAGNARIMEYAVVAGNAYVADNAVVGGYAAVIGTGKVVGSARLRDHALVGNGGLVSGNGLAEQYAHIENSTVTGNAIARGNAHPQGGTISGTAIIDGDYAYYYSLSDGVHYGHWAYGAGEYADYTNRQAKPRGLMASYRTEETSGSLWWDEFGSAQAILRGSPTRVADSFFNGSPVLQLDGSTQYAVLDRQLADLTDASYSLWFNPATATANQSLLYFGSSAGNYFKIVGRDASGLASVTLCVGGVSKTITASTVSAAGSWTHVGVTVGAGTMSLYINGQLAGTIATSFTPAQTLAANDLVSADGAYAGRDDSGNYFNGKLEDVRVYNVALTASEMANEVARSGAFLGRFYRTAPGTFNGTSTTADSGVHAGLVRTISAWIKPNSAGDTGTYYKPIADATDITGAQTGNGLGVNNGAFAVRLDNNGMWYTGVAVTLGQWQQVTLTLSGSVANLYVNGVLRANKAYYATGSNVPGESYRIGYGQTSSDVATRTWFDGQIQDLQIADRVIPPTLETPYAWYRADQSVGPTLTDSSGASKNATLTSSYSFITGKTGNALVLSGGYATLPTGIVSGMSDFTISTWVYLTANSAWNRIFDFGTGTTANMFLTPNAGNGNLRFAITSSGGGGEKILNGPAISLNTWTHIAVSVSGDLGTLYVNGAAVATNSSMTTHPRDLGMTNQNYLGKSQYSDPAMAGRIDDFRIYATSLPATAISALYALSAAPTIATAAATSGVTSTTANLSVLGASAAGEASLTYTWTLVGTPAGPVYFSSNGTNAAKNTTVTFNAPGTYTFLATIYDVINQSVSSSTVSVTMTSQFSGISPSIATVLGGTQQQLTPVDQFGTALPFTSVMWSTSAGSISSKGLFTAPIVGTSATVTATTTGFAPQSALLTITSPLAWYKLDAASGTAVTDSSGHSYNGTTASTVSWGTGQIGNALTLAGGYATLPTSLVSSLTDFTIAGWVNLTTANSWARLFDFGSGTGKYLFLAPADGSGLVHFNMTGSGQSYDVVSSSALSTGAWHFLAVTLAGSTCTLYVDGVAVGSSTSVALTPNSIGATSADYLGKSQYAGDPTLRAAIDDLRIYGTGLSSSSIAALYTAWQIPTLTTAAAGSPATVNGTYSGLSVLGADAAGESSLSYSWAIVGTSPAPVAFTANGTNAAKNAGAFFIKSGIYTLECTISDGTYAVTSSVTLTVNSALSMLVVSPAGQTMAIGQTQQFGVTAYDQFGEIMSTPALTWSVSGPGSVNASGLYTATLGGSAMVTATSGGVSGNASVQIASAAPTIVMAALASQSTVTGTTVDLSVLADDDGGEASLVYTWSLVSGAAPVNFSNNNGNSSKVVSASFQQAGSYVLRATVTDGSGYSVTSDVNVTVVPSATQIALTPRTSSVGTGQTKQLAAIARDQFGAVISNPTVAWSVISGTGTVNGAGLFSAGSVAGQSVVRVTAGAISTTTTITTFAWSPYNLVAKLTSPSTIRVQFRDSTTIETGFQVQVGLRQSNGVIAWGSLYAVGASAGSGGTVTYTLPSSFTSGTWYVRARAVSGATYSNWSNRGSVVV